MFSIKVAFSVGVTALLLSVVAVAPALSASPEWEDCEEVASGKFTESLCAKSGTGKWEWIPEATAVKVVSSEALELEDEGSGTEIECTGTNEGTVGPGKLDSITAVTITSCKFIKAGLCMATKPVTIKFINLPWKTELGKGEGTEVRDLVTGEPGYKVECTVGGIFKVLDECEGNTSARIENMVSNSTVNASFDAKSANGNCSIGGAGKGRVRGPVNIKQANGHGLRVK